MQQIFEWPRDAFSAQARRYAVDRDAAELNGEAASAFHVNGNVANEAFDEEYPGINPEEFLLDIAMQELHYFHRTIIPHGHIIVGEAEIRRLLLHWFTEEIRLQIIYPWLLAIYNPNLNRNTMEEAGARFEWLLNAHRAAPVAAGQYTPAERRLCRGYRSPILSKPAELPLVEPVSVQRYAIYAVVEFLYFQCAPTSDPLPIRHGLLNPVDNNPEALLAGAIAQFALDTGPGGVAAAVLGFRELPNWQSNSIAALLERSLPADHHVTTQRLGQILSTALTNGIVEERLKAVLLLNNIVVDD